jgi:biotin-(acetyl-CoA carboxylase) ligase
MIDNQEYYNALSTTELIELLTETTQKYLSLPIGESERILASYRELFNFLQKEIQQRSSRIKVK